MNTRFATFGQELYQTDSIRAIEQFHGLKEHDQLMQSIADILPHPSAKTRKRVALKLIQRHFAPSESAPNPLPYLHLVRSLPDTRDRTDLIYWRTARTDRLISAIASEIFYPYFVSNSIPDGYTEQQFDLVNTNVLFSIDRIITTDFVTAYAERIWGFACRKCIGLALRIMRQSGMIDAIHIRKSRKNVLGYYSIPHSISARVFAFCLYEEFTAGALTGKPSLDQVQGADCVKLFFLSRLQLDAALRALETKRVIRLVNQYGGRYVQLLLPDTDALVRLLVEGGAWI